MLFSERTLASGAGSSFLGLVLKVIMGSSNEVNELPEDLLLMLGLFLAVVPVLVELEEPAPHSWVRVPTIAGNEAELGDAGGGGSE